MGPRRGGGRAVGLDRGRDVFRARRVRRRPRAVVHQQPRRPQLLLLRRDQGERLSAAGLESPPSLSFSKGGISSVRKTEGWSWELPEAVAQEFAARTNSPP